MNKIAARIYDWQEERDKKSEDYCLCKGRVSSNLLLYTSQSLYNHILAIFENFQKFHFLDKKLYFEGFRLGFSNWNVKPSILGNLQLLSQSFVSWKSSLKTKKRRFLIFSNFEKWWFYFLPLKRGSYSWVKLLLF